VNKQTQFRAAGIPHYSTVLSFHHSSPMPIVQTKPNLGTLGCLGNETRDTRHMRQTNPTLRLRIADLGLWDRPAASGLLTASAPNKPNFGPGKMKGKCCANEELQQVGCGSGPGKTKPIRPRGGYRGSGFSGPRPGVRTSGQLYKQTQFSRHGRSRPWYSWAKPALSEAEGTPMLQNALRRHYEQGCCAKQTQFRVG
jgi:hypothetical protein